MKPLFYISVFITTALLMSFICQPAPAQTRERSTVETEYTWNLEDIYATDEDWQKALDKLLSDVEIIESYKGKLGSSSEVLLEFLNLSFDFNRLFNRIYSYASLKSDQDIRDTKYVSMDQELRQLQPVIRARLSFGEPELLAIGKETIDRFLNEQPEMTKYKMHLYELFRQMEHVLSDKEERISTTALIQLLKILKDTDVAGASSVLNVLKENTKVVIENNNLLYYSSLFSFTSFLPNLT